MARERFVRWLDIKKNVILGDKTFTSNIDPEMCDTKALPVDTES